MPIVAAAATFTARKTNLAKRIERAMSGAVLQCVGENITDPDIIREKMLAARDRVLAART